MYQKIFLVAWIFFLIHEVGIMITLNVSSVQSISHVQLFATPWIAARQASLSITNSRSSLKTHVHRVSDAIQPSHPLSPSSPPAFNLFPASGSFPVNQFFTSGGQSIGVSASTSILPMNIQDWLPLQLISGLISFPTPQFKSINSLALSFLYSPTLTSVYDYWKNHRLFQSLDKNFWHKSVFQKSRTD